MFLFACLLFLSFLSFLFFGHKGVLFLLVENNCKLYSNNGITDNLIGSATVIKISWAPNICR